MLYTRIQWSVYYVVLWSVRVERERDGFYIYHKRYFTLLFYFIFFPRRVYSKRFSVPLALRTTTQLLRVRITSFVYKTHIIIYKVYAPWHTHTHTHISHTHTYIIHTYVRRERKRARLLTTYGDLQHKRPKCANDFIQMTSFQTSSEWCKFKLGASARGSASIYRLMQHCRCV